MNYGDMALRNPINWGRALIKTHDHDPLYTALWRYNRQHGDDFRLERFLIAYWMCYHVGASWWISNHNDPELFWELLLIAAKNEVSPQNVGAPERVGDRWPRAHERRHWRGEKAVNSVRWFAQNFPEPHNIFRLLENVKTLQDVEDIVKPWPQFGPWIAFKMADMLERTRYSYRIEFPSNITTVYRDPLQGAVMMGRLYDREPQEMSEYLTDALSDLAAPPKDDRPVGVQEVETVFCKWKSAFNGRYWLGCDTNEHRIQLEHWRGGDLQNFYPVPPALPPHQKKPASTQANLFASAE